MLSSHTIAEPPLGIDVDRSLAAIVRGQRLIDAGAPRPRRALDALRSMWPLWPLRSLLSMGTPLAPWSGASDRTRRARGAAWQDESQRAR